MEDQTITVGGRKFVVPPLSARRIIELLELGSKLVDINAQKPSGEQVKDIYRSVLIGIQQGKPDFTLDELMDLPIPIDQAMAALGVVQRQAGWEIAANPEQAAGAIQPATSPPSKINGTSGSPT